MLTSEISSSFQLLQKKTLNYTTATTTIHKRYTVPCRKWMSVYMYECVTSHIFRWDKMCRAEEKKNTANFFSTPEKEVKTVWEKDRHTLYCRTVHKENLYTRWHTNTSAFANHPHKISSISAVVRSSLQNCIQTYRPRHIHSIFR